MLRSVQLTRPRARCAPPFPPLPEPPVSLLRPANYRLEVSKAGFKVAVQENIPVHITETETLDVLELVVGATKETVEVVANAELLQTQQSTLGHVVDPREVVDLPLVTRNYTRFSVSRPVFPRKPSTPANLVAAAFIGNTSRAAARPGGTTISR